MGLAAPKDAGGARQAEAWELRIAFREPVTVGTVVFLTDADSPPIGPSRVLPPGTRVRAVRLTERHSNWHPNLVRCLLLAPRFDSATPEAVGSGEPGPFGSHPNAIPHGEVWVGPAAEWFARIEGMRLLRRRFEPVADVRVRVNSGSVGRDGVWDAARTEAPSQEKPGEYVLEWDKAQLVSGLAIKEIERARTEIDVWDGAAAGPVALECATGWKHVATYDQARRDSYEPGFERNDCARYLDGMVDFGEPVTTRAVRLRVVAQWTGNGERGTASGQRNREGRSLDLRRCKVHGVLALKPLGSEPALDPVVNRRIEVRDGKTGGLKKELSATAVGGLVVGPTGELYTVQAGRVTQIDPETGAAKAVISAVNGTDIKASRVAVGPDGTFFVHVLPQHVVQVYKLNGDLVRTIGKPGGHRPGPWDPE